MFGHWSLSFNSIFGLRSEISAVSLPNAPRCGLASCYICLIVVWSFLFLLQTAAGNRIDDNESEPKQ